MLEACGCRFEGLESFGAASTSEFEKLNNAIVKASLRGGQWYKLASDWQDRVVEERDWKIAIPPLWSSLLEEFWAAYAQLYRVETNRTGLSNPYDVAPTGIPGALKDLWAPTAQVAQATSAAAAQALQDLKAKATAKVQSTLRSVGREISKGAAEETKDTTTNWGVWLAGAGAVLAIGYLALNKPAF